MLNGSIALCFAFVCLCCDMKHSTLPHSLSETWEGLGVQLLQFGSLFLSPMVGWFGVDGLGYPCREFSLGLTLCGPSVCSVEVHLLQHLLLSWSDLFAVFLMWMLEEGRTFNVDVCVDFQGFYCVIWVGVSDSNCKALHCSLPCFEGQIFLVSLYLSFTFPVYGES